MYNMIKTYQNLKLFGPDFFQALSILESRKTTRLTLRLAEDYNLDLLHNGSACATKQAVVKRTSEILFIDKWYGPGEKQNRARRVWH